jgi:Zn-dependent membrane protease YugP
MVYMDSTFLLIIPGLLLSALASFLVKSTYRKYSKVRASAGLTAAQTAEQILRQGGAQDVRVERVPGELTDHYDPRDNVLRLSQGVFDSTSVAALGIAAHEAGHALQRHEEYAPLSMRTAIVPAISLTSNAAGPLFLLGLLLSWQPLLWIGILCFAGALLFSLITLPVEFDASRRAVYALEAGGFLSREENQGARKVLTAAAMTYVATALMAFLQLARMLMIASGSRRRD